MYSNLKTALHVYLGYPCLQLKFDLKHLISQIYKKERKI